MEKQQDLFEKKILKQTCALLILISLVGIVINIVLKLDFKPTLILIALAIFSAINLWFLIHNKYFKFTRLFLSGLLILIINSAWYYNYTSQGPILGTFIILTIFIVFIWPRKTALFFNIFILINVATLFFIDSHFSEFLIKYPSENARINDTYFGTLMVIILALFFSYFAKSSYLKKYEEAKKSDELKTAFLRNMSHEFRTPLNAIIGFSELINEKLSAKETAEFANIIKSSGNHLLTIVEDLFDITLIESGELKILKEEVQLLDLLHDVQKIFINEQQKTNKNTIKLNLIIPPQVKDIQLNTDPSRLKQIIINLIKNALKFTDTGYINYGFDIESNNGKSHIKFFVEDTGIGISEQNIEFIFDVFKQIENSSTRNISGAGIGLSISKQLTELLGGKIWVESKEGKGSIFYFTIPYSGTFDAKKRTTYNYNTELEIIENKEPKKILILIVEDDEPSYKFLEITLKKSGFDSIWAKNGEESVQFCTTNKSIDLVLMDIQLPIMSGFEATKKIKKFCPTLPIIAQTAFAVSGDREKSIEAGCVDYISKPIKQDILLSKIKIHLNIRH